MIKKILVFLLTLGLCMAASADGPRYRSVPLRLVPGVSVGPILIGQPVSPATYEMLGPPSKQNESMILWSLSEQLNFEEGIMLKLDGRGRVAAVYLAYVDFSTTGGASQGNSLTQLQQAHPQGQYIEGRGGNSWRLPGLEVLLNKNDRAELFVLTCK